jgi:hypothetical protein
MKTAVAGREVHGVAGLGVFEGGLQDESGDRIEGSAAGADGVRGGHLGIEVRVVGGAGRQVEDLEHRLSLIFNLCAACAR